MLRREKKKQKEILSDKIANLLTVAPNADVEDDLTFGTKPKTVTREELESDGDSAEEAALSSFRKQNASLLADLSGRYAGEVTSRKDLGLQDSDHDSIQIDSDDVAGDSDNEEGKSSDNEGFLETGEDQDESGELDAENDEVESGDDASDSDQEEESELEDSDFEGSQDGFDLSEISGPSKDKDSESQFKHFKEKDVSEEVEKGKCVRNQLSIWESLLEMRINIQKCLIAANKMPFPETFKKLKKDGGHAYNNALNRSKGSVTSLMSRLMELQSLLLSKYPETKDLFSKNNDDNVEIVDLMDEEIPSDSDSVSSEKEVEEKPRINKKRKLADYSDELSNRFATYTKYRNSVIQKWNDKTRIASNQKNQPAPISIIAQIQFILNDSNKLTRRTQLRRTKYQIIGENKSQDEILQVQQFPLADKNNQSNSHKEYCSEIFDDDDFYHQLLRELIEHKSSDISDPIQLSRQWIMLQQMRSKMKRKIDTRATKGRRIRYAVHSKLVNFMAPQPNLEWTDEMKDELYASLFGKQFEGNTDGAKSEKNTNGGLHIMS